jgi:hypothetical protein
MIIVLVNTLMAFAGIVIFAGALLLALLGLLILIVARKGDGPVKFSPRAVGLCAMSVGGFVAGHAIMLLVAMAPL